MATNKPTLKRYDDLYTRMEEDLAEATDGQVIGTDGLAIAITREKIRELKEMAGGSFADREAEIHFFREVWPRFYARLFLLLLVHRFELDRLGLPVGAISALMRREEKKVVRFFRQYRDFWQYYRSGSPLIEGQFVRVYSQNCVYDPLSQVLDPEWATLASYRVAWGLAYEEYLSFLRDEKDGGASVAADGVRYEWKESKSAAVELIKSQAEAGSIYINGKPATSMQLKADFERKYKEDLRDFDKLLYATDTRKIDPTAYLTKLINAFMGRRERLGK